MIHSGIQYASGWNRFRYQDQRFVRSGGTRRQLKSMAAELEDTAGRAL
jgi:hypothetical protein